MCRSQQDQGIVSYDFKDINYQRDLTNSPSYTTGIGQKFAMNEIKSILCKLIRNFEFTLAPDAEPLKIYSDLVLKSANGVKLIPKIRKL